LGLLVRFPKGKMVVQTCGLIISLAGVGFLTGLLRDRSFFALALEFFWIDSKPHLAHVPFADLNELCNGLQHLGG